METTGKETDRRQNSAVTLPSQGHCLFGSFLLQYVTSFTLLLGRVLSQPPSSFSYIYMYVIHFYISLLQLLLVITSDSPSTE